jgi:choline dehydrogenase-like flavoprotein
MGSKYDLILVGTGFASSFFLKRYLEKSSPQVRVLVLERSIFLPHRDRLRFARGEKVDMVERIDIDERSIENPNEKKRWGFGLSFGGGSNCWTGCVPRFMPNDFKMKTMYGVGMDWPMTYDELEPYYCQTEDIMSIAGPEETPYPMSRKYPLPPHKLSTVDKILQKQYGNMYISQPAARASIPVGKRGMCCSSGICDLCPVDAKFTIENTLMNIYHDPRVTLQYDSKVFSLETNNNVARSVLYMRNGKQEEAEGEIIAIGANAIFNAHILLNSGDKNRFTGKGLTEQIGVSAYLYLDKLSNHGGGSYISANGFMLFDGPHRKEHGAALMENHNYPFVRNEFGKWRDIAKFKFVIEDLPDDNNMVLTTEDVLKPKVIYSQRTEYAQKALDALPGNIEKVFSCLPVERYERDIDIQKTEYHICSTTRMSKTAEEGVIDKNLIHHQYRNLFVLGSGAFPTISPSNPTLTLAALSLSAADKSFGNSI